MKIIVKHVLVLEITLNFFPPQSKVALNYYIGSATYYSQPVVSLHKPRHSLVDVAEANK